MFKVRQEKKPALDERIQKETNKLGAKLFYLLTVLVIIGMVIQVIEQAPFRGFYLQIVCLVAGIGFVVVQLIRKGIFLVKDKDEVLTSIHEETLSHGYYIETFILLFGELIVMFLEKEQPSWISLYFFEWVIPSLILSVSSIKKSWLQWGGKRRQVAGKKQMKKMCIPAGLLCGVLMIVMELPTWLEDGEITLKEAVWIPYFMIAFAVMFYFVFGLMMDSGEKRANKSLEENEHEEMDIEK